MPMEAGTDVISPPRITNIPRASTTLTINMGEDELSIPEASQLKRPIEAQPVASMSILPQPTYFLLSSITSRLIRTDLETIMTIFDILDEYQMRVASPRERADYGAS